MSSIYHFLRRHRRKLLVGGAAVGGVLLAARLLESQLTKEREEEGRKFLEISRKRGHFESTENTCNSTTVHVYSKMKACILKAFDCSKLTEALRAGPDPAEKIRLWNEIKLLTFCKTTSFVICQAFLGVLLRVQLNLLAGYLFTDRVSLTPLLNNNREAGSTVRFPVKVQELYLNLSNYFLNQGFTDFSEVLVANVKKMVDGIKLQERLKLQDIENIHCNLLEELTSEFVERNLFSNPGKYLLSSQQPLSQLAGQMSESELEVFKTVLSETLEILESPELTDLTKRLCRRGFSLLTDNLTDTFAENSSLPKTSSKSLQENPQRSAIENAQSNDSAEFVSPCSVSVPLAKLLPAITVLVQEEEKEEMEDWLNFILDDSDLKLLGANIYETFCARQEEKTQTETWSQYIWNAASSLF